MFIVNIVLHVGEHVVGENEDVAPVGKPDEENEAGWVVPEINVEVIVFVVDCPCVIVLLPRLDKEKSNAGFATENDTIKSFVFAFPAASWHLTYLVYVCPFANPVNKLECIVPPVVENVFVMEE